jgi:hypothetical protein
VQFNSAGANQGKFRADPGVGKRRRISFEATKLIASPQDDGEFEGGVKNPTLEYGEWSTPAARKMSAQFISGKD